MYDIDVQADVNVNVDELCVNHVFLNLINHTIKFTSSGYIKVTINHDEHLMLSIEYSSIGIRKENLSRIFTPLDNESRCNVVHGTGLGLAIN